MKTNKISMKMAINAIAGIAIIIVTIYLAYMLHKEFKKTAVSQIQNQLLSTLKLAAKGLDEFIIYHQDALQILSNDPLIKERIYNKVQWKKDYYGEKFSPVENLYEAYKKHVDALTTIDANGKMLDRDPFWKDNTNRIGWDYSDKPGIACVLRKHKPCVSEIFYNNLGNLAVSISEPVFYKDKFAGIVRWMIETDTIAKRFIEPVKFGKKGFIWMFDNKNKVISHPRKDFIGITVLDAIRTMHKKRGEVFDESRTQEHIIEEHDYLNRVKSEGEGVGIFINCVTDERDIIAYKRFVAGNLILNLIASMSYSEITGPINKNAREIFGLSGFIIIILSTGGLFVFRGQKEKARLVTETRYLKQISDGAEALRESEERYRKFVEGTDDLVTRVDSNGRFTYVNDTSEKIFGLSPEECMGLSAFDFIHPDDREKTMAAFAEWVREQFTSIAFENRQVSQSGQVHYMQWTINQDLDKDGNVIAINSIARDLTELKVSEKRLKQYANTQEVLLREVNHRVKNNLAAIIGMLAMEEEHAVEKRRTYSLSFLKDLKARIRGLSTVHGLLSASGWQPFKLSLLCEQILKGALQAATSPKNIEISITPSSVMINSSQAHHLAMVINELTTNSIKHATANRDNIRINIIIEQDGAKTTVQFKDNGPGFPEEILKGDFSSSNIGFELIQGIVMKSLVGNVVFENDNGTVTTISFENEINIATRRDTV